MKNTTVLKMKWLLKDFFRPVPSDKIKCYNFESANYCIYLNSDQDRCMNFLEKYVKELLKSEQTTTQLEVISRIN